MKILLSLFILLVPLAAYSGSDHFDDQYFSDDELDYTPQEEAGLAIGKNWKAADGKGLKPSPGPDGSVSFVFGASQPSVICAVMQVCDIELQAGEQVNSIHIGDSARWTVEPAITGITGNQIQHLIIKPMDVGLNTSLIVTTDRRTYHLRLRSTKNDYMPRITFVYADEAMKQINEARAAQKQEYERKIIPETGEYLGNLDFKYRVEGNTSWKPVRVYNDGEKTILEMPTSMVGREAPTLLVVRREGDIFSDDEQVMVNYRVQNNRYIVDSLFDKAILIAGVGQHQDRVTITREQ